MSTAVSEATEKVRAAKERFDRADEAYEAWIAQRRPVREERRDALRELNQAKAQLVSVATREAGQGVLS